MCFWLPVGLGEISMLEYTRTGDLKNMESSLYLGDYVLKRKEPTYCNFIQFEIVLQLSSSLGFDER